MIRLVLLAVAIAAGAPAAAAASCDRDADRSRFELTGAQRSPTLRRLRVCDHATGRSQTLARRARSAMVSGDRAIWAALDRSGRGTIVLRDLRRGRTLLRRRLGFVVDSAFSVNMSVVVTPRFAAWSWKPTRGRPRLTVRRGGRTVARTIATFRELSVEDGRTLRWGLREAVDVLPPRRHDGCPVRARFRPIFDDANVRVTEATYGEALAYDVWSVLRACDRARRRERIIAPDGSEPLTDVVASGHGWLVLRRTQPILESDCPDVRLVVQRIADDLVARAGRTPCGRDLPVDRATTVVTRTGTPAWVRDGVLHAVERGGRFVVLDRGNVTGLTADGDTIRWRRDGVDHAVPL